MASVMGLLPPVVASVFYFPLAIGCLYTSVRLQLCILQINLISNDTVITMQSCDLKLSLPIRKGRLSDSVKLQLRKVMIHLSVGALFVLSAQSVCVCMDGSLEILSIQILFIIRSFLALHLK